MTKKFLFRIIKHSSDFSDISDKLLLLLDLKLDDMIAKSRELSSKIVKFMAPGSEFLAIRLGFKDYVVRIQ